MRFLNKLGMRAKSINSTVKQTERRDIRDSLMDEGTPIKFFYMCPEMAAMDFYTDFLHRMLSEGTISHVVVDEAHCLTDKSYRKAFAILTGLRINYPNVPFIALTTASKATIDNIRDVLGMKNPKIIQASSVKTNIVYEAVCMNEEDEVEQIDFLAFFKTVSPDFDKLKSKEMLSGIIYCRTNSEIDKILKVLEGQKVPATDFQSKDVHRFEKYDEWMSDKIPIMVTTTECFGLGIVKARVKFVVHVNVPKNMRGFYQVSYIKFIFTSISFLKFHFFVGIWPCRCRWRQICLTSILQIKFIATK